MADGTLAVPDWSVTMFSFTSELVSGLSTPLRLIEDVLETGVTDQIEIDAPQHFTSLPRFLRAEVEEFKELVQRRNVRLSAMGIYNDFAARPGTNFSLDESTGFVGAQIEAASELGFRQTRIAFPVDGALLVRLAPIAERVNVMLLQEVQGGALPADLERALEIVSAIRTDALGFVFDLSASMAGLPITYLEALRMDGVPHSVVQYLEDAWMEEERFSLRAGVAALVANCSLTPPVAARLAMPFTRFGNSPLSEWRALLPEFNAVHLKFWDLEDDAGRVTRPLADVRREFGAIGYQGILTSEWGGHEWMDLGAPSGIDMTVRHRAAYDSALSA